MNALFEQSPLLLPALGIVFAAAVLGLFWVGVILLGERIHRARHSHGSRGPIGGEAAAGVTYDSSGIAHECESGPDLGGGDCGGDGGGGD